VHNTPGRRWRAIARRVWPTRAPYAPRAGTRSAGGASLLDLVTAPHRMRRCRHARTTGLGAAAPPCVRVVLLEERDDACHEAGDPVPPRRGRRLRIFIAQAEVRSSSGSPPGGAMSCTSLLQSSADHVVTVIAEHAGRPRPPDHEGCSGAPGGTLLSRPGAMHPRLDHRLGAPPCPAAARSHWIGTTPPRAAAASTT
jgi:hypothetical protein